MLTLLLPLATALLAHTDWRMLAILLPPGSVYFGSTEAPNLWWLIGPVGTAGAALVLTRRSLLRGESELREWYNQNHGVSATG